MLPFLAGLGIKSWVHDYATPLMWTGAGAVAVLIAYSDRLPRWKRSLSSGSSNSDSTVPRTDYEKALQASATHEGVRGELKQQLEKSESDLGLTITEVHRRGSEIERLTRDLEGCEKRFVRPKLNVSVLSSEVTEIVGPPALDLGIKGLLGGRSTNNVISIRARLKVSNEHDKGTKIYSSGVGVYERPEDPIQNGGPSIGMDAELLAPIEFGCPREGWIEFQIERTDLQMVVNRYFVISVVDGTDTSWKSSPQKIYRVTQQSALQKMMLSGTPDPESTTHEN